MDLERFQVLLTGEEPTLEDYSAFAFITKHSSIDVLWNLLISNPKMHWILKSMINKSLQEKVSKVKLQQSMESIMTKLEERKGNP
jgi:hypothetical protein